MDQNLSPCAGVDLLERRDGVAGVLADGPILHRIGSPVAACGSVLRRRTNRLCQLIPTRPVLEEDIGRAVEDLVGVECVGVTIAIDDDDALAMSDRIDVGIMEHRQYARRQRQQHHQARVPQAERPISPSGILEMPPVRQHGGVIRCDEGRPAFVADHGDPQIIDDPHLPGIDQHGLLDRDAHGLLDVEVFAGRQDARQLRHRGQDLARAGGGRFGPQMLEQDEAPQHRSVQGAGDRAVGKDTREHLTIGPFDALDGGLQLRILAIEIIAGALVAHRGVRDRAVPVEVEQVNGLAPSIHREGFEMGLGYEVLILVVGHDPASSPRLPRTGRGRQFKLAGGDAGDRRPSAREPPPRR
nr:hypothetical protein [Brevundimonas diminuta]